MLKFLPRCPADCLCRLPRPENFLSTSSVEAAGNIPPTPARCLSCSSRVIVLDEFLRTCTLAISCCRLNTFSDSKVLQNPFSRLLGLIACDFSLGLLECLVVVSKLCSNSRQGDSILPHSLTSCVECYSSNPCFLNSPCSYSL